jgi:hypothetical protein
MANEENNVTIRRKFAYGLVFGFTVLLSGCVADRVLPFMAKPEDKITVTLTGTKVTIGGVPGYCVNKRQSKISKTTAFVVFGPCEPETVATNALLIASVSGETEFGDNLTPEALKEFFQSKRGHKLLSSINDPETVEIQEIIQEKGVLYIFSRDSAEPVIPETVNDKWRGFFPVSERMIAISMVNFEENAMPAKQALNQLKDFAASIKKLNKAGAL